MPSIEGRLTRLGTLVIEQEDDRVTLTMRPHNPERLRHGVRSDDGELVLEMWEGQKPPRVGDEVTVDATSFEVTKVEKDPGGGAIWVYGDNGRKVRWE